MDRAKVVQVKEQVRKAKEVDLAVVAAYKTFWACRKQTLKFSASIKRFGQDSNM